MKRSLYCYCAEEKVGVLRTKEGAYRAVDTTRGREVRVQTNTDRNHTLVVTTG